MYAEEDNFHPTNVNDYNDEYEVVGISDDFSDNITFTTLNSKQKKSKKDSDAINNSDKGYHKIKIPYGHKSIEIEAYSTQTTPGKPIRDAITGYRYIKHLVGSINENLYFKIILATGQLGNEGRLLFYNNPEECERHMKIVISKETKQKWTDKCLNLRLNNSE
jgi:hypothetical protein